MKAEDFSHTAKLPAEPCPRCNRDLSGATGSGNPAEEDYTVCLYCGGLLQFGPGLKLRRVSTEEFSQLHPELQKDLMHVVNIANSIRRKMLK